MGPNTPILVFYSVDHQMTLLTSGRVLPVNWLTVNYQIKVNASFALELAAVANSEKSRLNCAQVSHQDFAYQVSYIRAPKIYLFYFVR